MHNILLQTCQVYFSVWSGYVSLIGWENIVYVLLGIMSSSKDVWCKQKMKFVNLISNFQAKMQDQHKSWFIEFKLIQL